MSYASKDIRNIALLGHGGNGKTSLAESILFLTGATDRLGSSAAGNSVSDYDPEEIRRQISISASTMYTEYQKTKINIIDTPGYFDFAGEVAQALRVADIGIICVSAKDGLNVGAEKAWKALSDAGLPRAIYISKVDEEHADFYKAFEQLREKFGPSLSPMSAPIMSGTKVTGLVDILARKAYKYEGKNRSEIPMPADMADRVEEMYSEIAENAAGTSEEPAAPTAEEQALLTALKEKGVGLEMRMDMDEGMLYMTFTGEALESLGLPADTWYSMDMGALFEQLGMDYAELMDLSKTLDASAMLEAMLQSADLSDKDTAYATVAGLVDSAAKLLSDEGFQKNGSDYTTAYTYTQDGADMTLSFTLNTKNDKVVGYAMDIKMTMVTGAETGETTEVMTMTMGMDEKNHMTAEMKMDLLGLMSMNMTISGDYKTTDKTPAVEPPAGAVVVPFEELGMETAAPETAA